MALRVGIDDYIRDVAAFHLSRVEAVVDRDCVAIYGPIRYGVDRRVRDAIEELAQRKPKLAVILDTGGGVVEVVERMVDTMRQFYSDVMVIVPDMAMSAGTILAMSGDSIWMDYYSRLGPIDPQVVRGDMLVPAMAYLYQYDRLLEKDRLGKLTSAEFALLSRLDLGELRMFEQARDLSVTLLKKWLALYKFKDWSKTATKGTAVTDDMKTERAEEIARKLNDDTLWHSHGRGISRKTLEDSVNVRIDHLEDNDDLAKAVASYHSFLADLMAKRGLESFVHSRAYY